MVNSTLPDIQAGFRKGKGNRGKIANIRWIIEKARVFQKNTYFYIIYYSLEKTLMLGKIEGQEEKGMVG